MLNKFKPNLNNSNQAQQGKNSSSKEEVEKQIDEATRRAIKDYDQTFRILTEYDK